MDKETEYRSRFTNLDRVHRIDGKRVPVCQIPLDKEEEQRDQNGDDTNCGREVLVRPDLTDILVINDDRERHIPFSYHQWRTKVGKSTHEHHQSRSQDRRHAQRKNHTEKPFHARASHIGGSFQQRVVQILQCTRNIEKDQREQLCG